MPQYFKYDPVSATTISPSGSSTVPGLVQEGAAPFMGPVDIIETPDAYIFVSDAPGLSSKVRRWRQTKKGKGEEIQRKKTNKGDGKPFTSSSDATTQYSPPPFF